MLPFLRESKNKYRAKNSRVHRKSRGRAARGKNGIKKYISSSPKYQHPHKSKIKKFSQPKFSSVTDAEAIYTEPESTHIQSCDEGLLNPNPTKKLIREQKRLKHKKSFQKTGSSSLTKPIKENMKYHDPFQIFTQNSVEKYQRRMKTLKEVESTLNLINRDKNEIENYIKGRRSQEERRQKGLKIKSESKSQVKLKNERLGERLARTKPRNRAEISKVKSEGEFRRRINDTSSFTNSPNHNKPMFLNSQKQSRIGKKYGRRGKKKPRKKLDLNSLERNSRKYLRSEFKRPINLSSVLDNNTQRKLELSGEDRLSLPLDIKRKKRRRGRDKKRKSSERVMGKDGLTPLITDSPTLKMLGNSKNSEKLNKSTFRKYLETHRKESDEQQRSMSVESGLEEYEDGEESFQSITGFGLRTIPGKKNGARKTNQDSSFYETEILGYENLALFGVFDGHGPLGHRVSKFLTRNLLGNLTTNI